MNQGKYAVEILKKNDMLDYKSMAKTMETNLNLFSNETLELKDMTQYIHIVGSLLYLTNTRPNICFVVNTLSRYLVRPRWVHLIAAKHVMRYIKGMIQLGLYYGRDHDYRLYGYTYLDWVGRAPQVDVIFWDPP